MAGAGDVSPELIDELVLANHILFQRGVVDGFGHVSVRRPGHPDQFLISRSMAPALTTARDIQILDLNGDPVSGESRPSYLERFIHGEIYRVRPDVVSVVHSHSPSVIAFGLSHTPMRAMYHNAAFLAAGVPVFDIREKFGATDIVISSPDKGAALAETLADKPVALLRAHGMVTVGPTLPVAIFRAIFTVISANIQHQTIALGGRIAALDAEEGALADVVNVQTVGRSWDLWKKRVS